MPNLLNSIIETDLTVTTYLLCIAMSFICGIICAFATAYKSDISKSFTVALVILPAIVTTVIIMVNGNVGTGIAVAGAFSLVRFRSAPGKAKDIVCIFLAMTAGLTCAAGYIAIALIFTILVSAVMLILVRIPVKSERTVDLRMAVPESLHYADEFEDLFEQYTNTHSIIKVKTSNMGSLYKLHYKIELKDKNNTQEFINKLRCRNGNLEISISEHSEGSDEL